jgi:hypothetical protein
LGSTPLRSDLCCTVLRKAMKAVLLTGIALPVDGGWTPQRMRLAMLRSVSHYGVPATATGKGERDMKLMGCRSVADLSRENLKFR